jgi:hypothetical protein
VEKSGDAVATSNQLFVCLQVVFFSVIPSVPFVPTTKTPPPLPPPRIALLLACRHLQNDTVDVHMAFVTNLCYGIEPFDKPVEIKPFC